jgi:hypothetical protein
VGKSGATKDALLVTYLLIMDEAAYIDNGDEVFGAALGSIRYLGEKLHISPKGMDKLYYKTYDKAKTVRII